MTANYRPPAEMVGLYTLDRFLKRTRGVINELLTSLTIMAPKCKPDDQLLLKKFLAGFRHQMLFGQCPGHGPPLLYSLI